MTHGGRPQATLAFRTEKRERAALGSASRPELTPPSTARAAPFRAARRDAVRARYAARRATAPEQARQSGCEGEERHGPEWQV